MKRFVVRYLILSSMTLAGMLLALYADLKIGEFLYRGELDDLIKQITLLLAFDIVVRESFRFSLLKVFSSAENNKIRDEMFGVFSLNLIVVGCILSLLYSCLYMYVLKIAYNGQLLIIVAVFFIIFISAGLQLVLNLVGMFFLYSLRVFLFPVSILCWVFYLNDYSLEYSFLIFCSSYLFLLVIFLRKIFFRVSFNDGFVINLKRYFIPPLFTMTNYSFLQASRYLERSLVASVSVGSSYFIYFSFKLYSSFVSLIGLPVSAMNSKLLISKEGLNRMSTIRLLILSDIFVLVVWVIACGVLLMLWEAELIENWFPRLANKEFLNLVVYYFLAALFGSLNLPVQACVYKNGGHLNMMKMIVVLSVVYMSVILIGSNCISSYHYSFFVSVSFLCYVLVEFALSLIILHFLRAL